LALNVERLRLQFIFRQRFTCLAGFSLYLPDGFNVNSAPYIDIPTPPSNNDSAFFVGVPLKVRERVELAEFEASIP
jgi:hypothetical protein